MSKFKVGDRVKVVGAHAYSGRSGRIGTLSAGVPMSGCRTQDAYCVQEDDRPVPFWAYESELAFAFKVGDRVRVIGSGEVGTIVEPRWCSRLPDRYSVTIDGGGELSAHVDQLEPFLPPLCLSDVTCYENSGRISIEQKSMDHVDFVIISVRPHTKFDGGYPAYMVTKTFKPARACVGEPCVVDLRWWLDSNAMLHVEPKYGVFTTNRFKPDAAEIAEMKACLLYMITNVGRVVGCHSFYVGAGV